MEFYTNLTIDRLAIDYKAESCPFCRSNNNVLCEANYPGAVTSWFYIKCYYCGAQGGVGISAQHAIDNWNDREN